MHPRIHSNTHSDENRNESNRNIRKKQGEAKEWKVCKVKLEKKSFASLRNLWRGSKRRKEGPREITNKTQTFKKRGS